MKVLCCESCSSGQRLAAPTEWGVGGRRAANPAEERAAPPSASCFSYSPEPWKLYLLDLKQSRVLQPGSKPSRSFRPSPNILFMRGTPSPAQRQTAVQENSGCGRAAPCSPASGPPCPCPAGSSPPRTAPYSGSGPPSPQSSGRASSSCCVLSAGPRRGAWPGRTRVVVWRPSLERRPSAWLEGTERADHWLETDGKALKIA